MRWLLLLCALWSSPVRAQDDVEGKDHPLLSRMPGFFIAGYTQKDFEAFAFPVGTKPDGDRQTETVEGKYTSIVYNRSEGSREVSAAQIFRNHENALRQAKATVVARLVEPGNSYSFLTAKLVKPGSEVWVHVTGVGEYYQLDIVEKQAMAQVIQADELYAALAKDGFVALDVHFDTGKATIRPESQPLVEQIAKLLREHPALQVGVEGHTDATGTAAANKRLSEERSRSVTAAVARLGVAERRMKPAGWGQERPVADNRTEEGRARNRRVEIVKR